MADHYNAAYRVKNIFEQALGLRVQNNDDALHVWATVLNVKDDDENKLAAEVIHRLTHLREQLEMVRSGMKTQEYASNLYDKEIQILLSTTAVRTIRATWHNNHARWVKPEVRKAMQFWPQILVSDEEPIDEGELEKTLSGLLEFRKDVETSDLPDSVRTFILEQLAIIERAFHLYDIIGAKAFGEATYEFQFHLLRHGQEVNKAASDEDSVGALKRLQSLWLQVMQWASHADTSIGLAERIPKLLEAAGELLDKLGA